MLCCWKQLAEAYLWGLLRYRAGSRARNCTLLHFSWSEGILCRKMEQLFRFHSCSTEAKHTSQPGSLGIVQTGQKNKNGGKDIFSLKIRLPDHWTPAATLIPAVTTTDNSWSVLCSKITSLGAFKVSASRSYTINISVLKTRKCNVEMVGKA